MAVGSLPSIFVFDLTMFICKDMDFDDKNKTVGSMTCHPDAVSVTFGGVLRPSSRYALRLRDHRYVAGKIADLLSVHGAAKGYFTIRLNGNLYMVSFIVRKDTGAPYGAELTFCKITPLYFNQIVIFDRRTIESYIV